MPQVIQIDSTDHVAVCLTALRSGDRAQATTALEEIPAGHKIALRDIREGELVLKYGHVIGRATKPIRVGEHVHLHNLQSTLRDDVTNIGWTEPARRLASSQSPAQYFQGFRRPTGGVGIRNEIWIVNTVGCVNQASQRIAAAAHAELAGTETGIDGVHAFPHPFGCSQLGDDLNYTRRVLAALVRHPNAAAVLILGLGCENNQMKLLLEQLGAIASDRVRYFNAQEVTDEFEEGMSQVRELAQYARTFKREPVSIRELIVGTKCGGSDGFSGITANPLVGRVADRLCDAGATVLLSEVPEMFGAEESLLQRAKSREVFDQTLRMVNDFRGYFRRHNQPIDENPAPGNKAGGITTLAEKSLGCIQKGGRAPVTQILEYAEPARPGSGGLGLVTAPGNDGVSGTALTAAGSHLILFTTGRGTPMGFPVPTLKISTNTELAARKPQWIDFDAGMLVNEPDRIDTLGDELLKLVLQVASGERKARNETNGCREIAIWKDGVTV